MAEKTNKIQKDPGVYYDVPFEDYILIDAINHSELKKFSADSPYHYHYRKMNEIEDEKAAFTEGRMYHLAVLEPDYFEKNFIHTPKSHKDFEEYLSAEMKKNCEENPKRIFDKRTKEAKMIDKLFAGKVKELKKKNPKIKVVDYLIYWKSQEIAKKIRQHKIASRVVGESETEVTLVWEDKHTGLKCKARLDLLNKEKNYFGDFKKSKNAHPFGFAKDVRKYNYYSQVAFYWDGAVTLGLLDPKYFMFITVEDFEPFFVQPFFIKDNSTWLEKGREWYIDKIEKLNYCKESGDWHGYYDQMNNSFDLYELPELMDNRY